MTKIIFIYQFLPSANYIKVYRNSVIQRRKNFFAIGLKNELKNRFKNKILDINFIIAEIWGNIEGKAELNGIVLPSIDALIASTGIAYDLTVVTRNTSDMERTGVKLLNPWVSV